MQKMTLPKCLCDDYHTAFKDLVVGECPYGFERRCVDCPNFKSSKYGYFHGGFLSDTIDDLICRLFFLIKMQDEFLHDMDQSDL